MTNLEQSIFLYVYQANNLGDDLFTKILVERYPTQIFYIYGDKKKNTFLSSNQNVIIEHSLMQKIRSAIVNKLHLPLQKTQNVLASKCKATIEIGGSMFIEPNRPFLRNDLYEKRPFFVIGVNFGPYITHEYKMFCYDYLSDKSDVCFRDRYSYKELNLLNSRVAPDIIFSRSFPKINGTGVFISVMNLSRINSSLKKYQDDYEIFLINIIKNTIASGEKVTLCSFCDVEGDALEIENICNKLSDDEHKYISTLHYSGNIDMILEKMNMCEIIVGTRFHSIVLGLAMGKKVIPISYSAKTQHMMEDLGLENSLNQLDRLRLDKYKFCQLDEITLQELRKQANKHFSKIDNYLMQ